jgi:hypothetical protein
MRQSASRASPAEHVSARRWSSATVHATMAGQRPSAAPATIAPATIAPTIVGPRRSSVRADRRSAPIVGPHDRQRASPHAGARRVVD